jgi:release factor glutamine methyltransferase
LRIRDIIAGAEKAERTDALVILSFVLRVGKEEILAHPDRVVGEEEGLTVARLLGERRMGRPLAYISRSREFFSEAFYVDERVLIPRPETEILIEEALKMGENRRGALSIVDMGTGSGNIAVIMAKRLGARIVAVDVSHDALLVARRNVEALGETERVELACSDLFAGLRTAKRFDMVLANLPYVGNEEWPELEATVRDYEPRLALDGGTGGLEIYRRFLLELPGVLRSDGVVLCEVGGEKQARLLGGLMEKMGLSVVVRRDYGGRERILVGTWTGSS